MYAGLGIASVAFFWWRVPETKDRTLEEIERDAVGEDAAAEEAGTQRARQGLTRASAQLGAAAPAPPTQRSGSIRAQGR